MKKRVWWIGMVCFLMLTGCGGNSDTDSEALGEESTVFKNTELILPEMELLSFEDAETVNLADMLQQQGGGMMVQIGAGAQQGSGIIYEINDGKVRILTAAHVLAAAEENVRVTFVDGFSLVCDEFRQFESADAGFVFADIGDIPAENLGNYFRACVDKECFDAVQAGDGCIVMGSRTGVAAEGYEGEILDNWIYMEDYGQYMIWVKAEGRAGMSGGGLFDREGHFLGIISGGNDSGELAVVPLSLIRAETEKED